MMSSHSIIQARQAPRYITSPPSPQTQESVFNNHQQQQNYYGHSNNGYHQHRYRPQQQQQRSRPIAPRHSPSNNSLVQNAMVVVDISTTTTMANSNSSTSCNDLNRPSAIRRYWRVKHLRLSPFYEPKPGASIRAKVEWICAQLGQMRPETQAQVRINFIFNQCFFQLIPLGRALALARLILSPQDIVYHHLPSTGLELLQRHAVPTYHRVIEVINTAVAGHKVFLSFTLDRFKVRSEYGSGRALPESEHYALEHLFIIVGTLNSQNKVVRKFLLKATPLFTTKDNNLSDEMLRKEFYDALQLIWPVHDFLSKASNNLLFVITEPGLKMTNLMADIQRRSPDLWNFTHVLYCDSLLYDIEKQLRRRYRTAVDVIEVIRVFWMESHSFRDQYRFHSPVHYPPESFYESADFYRDHLLDVKRGVLPLKAPRLQAVRKALSTPGFSKKMDEFVERANLLRALGKANKMDPHELSCQVGMLMVDIQQANEANCTAASHHAYQERVEHELNGHVRAIQHAKTERFALLCELAKKQLHDTPYRGMATNAVTKSFLLKTVAKGHFQMTSAHNSLVTAKEWFPLAGVRQMEKCFPRFRLLFNSLRAPFPWHELYIYAVVYCYFEAARD